MSVEILDSPGLCGRIILAFVRYGLGVGKLKKFWSGLWKKTVGSQPVDILYEGARFRIQPFGNVIENRVLFSSRVREAKELACIRSACEEEGVFIDAGANIGYYSIMSVLLGYQRVLAIEPNPQTSKKLETNIHLNSFEEKITVVKKGLGPKECDRGILRIDEMDSGSSSLLGHQKQNAVEVVLTSLAKLLEGAGINKVTVLKIDIEGMEDQVLIPFFQEAGAHLYPAMIILEKNADLWADDLLGYLAGKGYEVHAETRGNVILKSGQGSQGS